MQGHLVSQLAMHRLIEYLKHSNNKVKAHETIFSQIYENIQKELFSVKDFNAHTSGSTLVTVMLEESGLLTCANVGDSRAILARQSNNLVI